MRKTDVEIKIRENGTRSHRLINNEPSLTQQQFRDDCDVNVILARIMRGEQGSPFLGSKGRYADVSALPTYQEALQTVIDANNAFMQLDAKTRLKFDNNPQKLIDYLSDEKNNSESYQLGLREKPKVKPDPHLDALNEIKKNTAQKKATPKSSED